MPVKDRTLIDHANRQRSAQFIASRMGNMSIREASEKAREQGFTLSPISISRYQTEGLSDLKITAIAALSYLFNTSPNEIAELLGVWSPPQAQRDPRIYRVAAVTDKMPPEDRERFLDIIDRLTTAEEERLQSK